MTTNNVSDYFYNNTIDSTMYYTTSTGTLSTITIDTSSLIDTSNLTFTSSPGSSSTISLDDIYKYEFPTYKEFENIMPDLTKIEEMCSMYPALDKAFENFKAIYNLVKDDYQARKDSDT